MPSKLPKKHPCEKCGAKCCHVGLVGGAIIGPHEHVVRAVARRKGMLDDSGNALKTAGDRCIALVDGRCAIHESKPEMCRTFPFGETAEGGKYLKLEKGTLCPGLREFVAEHPESLMSIGDGQLYLDTHAVMGDEMLRDSLLHTLRIHNIRGHPRNLPIATVGREWADDPRIMKRLRQLRKQGLNIEFG